MADDTNRKRRKRLGKAIEDRRSELHMSQRDLAEVAGVDNGTVSRIERGTISPSLETLIKLAAGLSFDLAALVSEIVPREGRMRPSYRVASGTWDAMTAELLGQVLDDLAGDRQLAAAQLGITARKLSALLP